MTYTAQLTLTDRTHRFFDTEAEARTWIEWVLDHRHKDLSDVTRRTEQIELYQGDDCVWCSDEKKHKVTLTYETLSTIHFPSEEEAWNWANGDRSEGAASAGTRSLSSMELTHNGRFIYSVYLGEEL